MMLMRWTRELLGQDSEKDLLEAKLAQLRNTTNQPSQFPHEVLKMVRELVLQVVQKQEPTKTDFEQANKRLWIITNVLADWIDRNPSTLDGKDEKSNTLLHAISAICRDAYQSGSGLLSWNAIKGVPGYEAFSMSDVVSFLFIKILNNTSTINEKNQEGNTAFHILATVEPENIGFNAWALLLQKEPDLTLKNEKGATCHALAKEAGGSLDILLSSPNAKTIEQIAGRTQENIISKSKKFRHS